MKTHFILFLLILCSACFTTTKTSAGSTHITVGISTGYPPYYYYQDDQAAGICIDVLNQVAQDLDLEITYKTYPWKRLLVSAEQGQVDAIMPLFRTKEREKFLYFDGLDIAPETTSFFTLKGSGINYDGNFNSLVPYTIGVVDNYSYGQLFDQYDNFQKIVTRNDAHHIEMFKFKRFKVGVANRGVAIFYARQQGIADTIQFLAPPVSQEPLYIGFSKKRGHKQLAKKVAASLKKIRNSALYNTILERYGMSY